MLYRELDRIRRKSDVLDLIDTNFHSCGFRFPASILSRGYADYLASRAYAPDPRGASAARAAVAEYYSKAGIDVGPDNVLITASTSEAYRLLFTALCEPGDVVALPWPMYPLFEHLAQHCRLTAARYRADPSSDFQVDVDALDNALPEDTKLVVLISPNNPTGRIADRRTVEDMLTFCRDRGIALVCDEVFVEMAERPVPRPAALADASVTVFTLNGVSKLFASPDLKAAWIVGTGPEAAGALDAVEIANDMYLNCSSPTEHLLPYLFGDGGEFRQRLTKEVNRRRAVLRELFSYPPRGRLVPPHGGIHALFELPGLDDEDTAVELLRQERVFVHPGYLYGFEDETYFVLSCLPAEDRLREGVARLMSFLARLQ